MTSVCIALIGFVTSLFVSAELYATNNIALSISICATAVFMCRFFAFVHDAGHYSLFKQKWLNEVIGTICGFFILIPFGLWQNIHRMHHSSFANLNKRHNNPELWTLTLAEYNASSSPKKLAYRVLRSSFIRVFIDPISIIVLARIPHRKLSVKANIYVTLTNFVYALLVWYFIQNEIFLQFALTYLLAAYFFLSFATIIVYLQHQFEDSHWYEDEDWNIYDASIHGASYLKFGSFMRWLTGNVGFHHIHHLNPNIPFYNLPAANQNVIDIIKTKPIKLLELNKHLRSKLWDEKNKRLVGIPKTELE